MNTHEFLLDQRDPSGPLEVMAALRDHVDGLPETRALWYPTAAVDQWNHTASPEMLEMLGAWRAPDRYRIGSQKKARYVNPAYVHAKSYSDLTETCECEEVTYGYGRGKQMDNGPIGAHDEACPDASQKRAHTRLYLRRVAWLKRAGLLYIRQPVARKRLGFEHDFSATRLIQPLGEGYHDWYGRGKTAAANTMTILRGWGVGTELIADAYGVSRQCVYTMKHECDREVVTARAPDALGDHRPTA